MVIFYVSIFNKTAENISFVALLCKAYYAPIAQGHSRGTGRRRLRQHSDMNQILLTNGTHPGAAAPRLLSLRDAAGTRVHCRRGRGWITVEGDPVDYWISAGEDLHIRAATRVIIAAEGCGELLVTPPRAPAGACASPRQSAAATDHGALQETNMKSVLQRGPSSSYRKWSTAGAGVETALFISVQAVMMMCIVLVAAQLFATA